MKITYKISIVFVLAVMLFTACDKNEMDRDWKGAKGIEVIGGEYTPLDNVVIGIKADGQVFKSAQIISHIIKNRKVDTSMLLGKVNIDKDLVQFTTSFEKVGFNKLAKGDKVRIEVKALAGDFETSEFLDIKQKAPVSIDFPSIIENEDTYDVAINVAVKNATISKLTIEKRKNSEPYVAVTPQSGDWPVAGTTLKVKVTDYKAGDTLSYKVTVTASGGATALVEKKYIIGYNEFEQEYKDIELLDASLSVDLKNGILLKHGTDSSDLKLALSASKAGVESENNTMFVKVTDPLVYSKKDKMAAQRIYDEGTPSANVSSVLQDNVYVFKIKRGTKYHYGLIKITDVTIRENDKNTIKFNVSI